MSEPDRPGPLIRAAVLADRADDRRVQSVPRTRDRRQRSSIRLSSRRAFARPWPIPIACATGSPSSVARRQWSARPPSPGNGATGATAGSGGSRASMSPSRFAAAASSALSIDHIRPGSPRQPRRDRPAALRRRLQPAGPAHLSGPGHETRRILGLRGLWIDRLAKRDRDVELKLAPTLRRSLRRRPGCELPPSLRAARRPRPSRWPPRPGPSPLAVKLAGQPRGRPALLARI